MILYKKIFYISILCLAVFIAADDQTVIVTLLPSMVLDLRISIGELNKISWTITSYLLGFTIINDTPTMQIGIMAPPPIACKNLNIIIHINFEGK